MTNLKRISAEAMNERFRQMTRDGDLEPRGYVPIVRSWDCVCLNCGERVSTRWTDYQAQLWQAAARLRCSRCHGAIEILRADLGSIGSAQAVHTSKYETTVKRRVA